MIPYYYSPPIVFAQITHTVEGDNVNIQINPVEPSPPPNNGGSFSAPSYNLVPDSENCIDCTQPQLIFNQPFYNYAVEQLSDKFPFDILGDLPAAPSGCPSLQFSINTINFSRQFCFISDVANFLKYPIWIAFGVVLLTHT